MKGSHKTLDIEYFDEQYGDVILEVTLWFDDPDVAGESDWDYNGGYTIELVECYANGKLVLIDIKPLEMVRLINLHIKLQDCEDACYDNINI